jgi:hypothetical protein
MTVDELRAILDLDLHKEWDQVSGRRDLTAFNLIDQLCPDTRDRSIVSGAEHDQIWIGVTAERLASVITDEQARLLNRCGVFYDTECDCLSMFK